MAKTAQVAVLMALVLGAGVRPARAQEPGPEEAIVVTDAVTLDLQPVLTLNVSEGIGVGDAIGSAPSAWLAVPESVVANDLVDVDAPPPVVIQVSEVVGVGDAVGSAPAAWLALPEAVGVADTVALDIPPVVDLRVTEAVTVADAAQPRPAVMIQVSESVGVGDAARTLPALVVPAVETVAVQDTVSVFVPPVIEIHVAEAVAVMDAVESTGPVSIHVVESVQVGDAAGVLVSDLGADFSATEGQEIHVSGGSSDLGGEDPPAIEWTFGDGTSTSGSLSASHVYADNGTYAVTLTVTGSSGTSLVQSFDLLAQNVAPAATAGANLVVDEGSPTALAGAGFLDLGTLDMHTAIIDWGDGFVAPGVVTESPFGPPGATSGLTGSVMAAHVYANDGVFAVTVTVVDDDGGLGVAGAVVSVRNVPPTAHDQSVTTGEDVPVAIVLTASDPGADTLSFSVLVGPAHGSLSGTRPELVYTPAPGYLGADSFTFQASDGEAASAPATVTVTVVPEDDRPAISVAPPAQSVQYSDFVAPIVVSAHDTDSADLEISTSALPDRLALGPGDCVAEGHGVGCTWTIAGPVEVTAGDREIAITVSDAGSASAGTATVNVEPEDAVVQFDDANPVAVPTAAPGGTSGEFALTARIREEWPDLPESSTAPGDLGLADASMVLLPVGPGVPVEPLGACGRTLLGQDYDAWLVLTCSFDSVEVNVYSVVVSVNGGYYTGDGEAALSVYDPSRGFVTGGGWFDWPGSNQGENGTAGDRATFAFTVKPTKKGTDIRGQLRLIRHLPDGASHRLKSNALDGLVVGQAEDPAGETYGWAFFSGMATYRAPGWPKAVGNYRLLAYVEDRDEPGRDADRFWIELRDGQGNVIEDLSMPREPPARAVPIGCGNIVVPHRSQTGAK
jgi:hypothetical protein